MPRKPRPARKQSTNGKSTSLSRRKAPATRARVLLQSAPTTTKVLTSQQASNAPRQTSRTSFKSVPTQSVIQRVRTRARGPAIQTPPSKLPISHTEDFGAMALDANAKDPPQDVPDTNDPIPLQQNYRQHRQTGDRPPQHTQALAMRHKGDEKRHDTRAQHNDNSGDSTIARQLSSQHADSSVARGNGPTKSHMHLAFKKIHGLRSHSPKQRTRKAYDILIAILQHCGAHAALSVGYCYAQKWLKWELNTALKIFDYAEASVHISWIVHRLLTTLEQGELERRGQAAIPRVQRYLTRRNERGIEVEDEAQDEEKSLIWSDVDVEMGT